MYPDRRQSRDIDLAAVLGAIVISTLGYFVYKLFKPPSQRGKTIFISYNHADMKHKNILVAWAKNENFPFSFEDRSTDLSVASEDIGAIRRAVSARIGSASCFLCVVGQKTASSEWVCWEIEKAIEREKPIVAVKIKRSCKSPKPLFGASAAWAMTFKFDSIAKAIDEALR